MQLLGVNWGQSFYKHLGHRHHVLVALFDLQRQLRQRVAWALSQICTISSSGLGRDSENEVWAVYYDIFVRHAFGNYRDILREVSYNPLMADYLSFRRNRAFAVAGSFPDENYAREIMQLFSIGLWKLKKQQPIFEIANLMLQLVIHDSGRFPVFDLGEACVNFHHVVHGGDKQNYLR